MRLGACGRQRLQHLRGLLVPRLKVQDGFEVLPGSLQLLHALQSHRPSVVCAYVARIDLKRKTAAGKGLLVLPQCGCCLSLVDERCQLSEARSRTRRTHSIAASAGAQAYSASRAPMLHPPKTVASAG